MQLLGAYIFDWWTFRSDWSLQQHMLAVNFKGDKIQVLAQEATNNKRTAHSICQVNVAHSYFYVLGDMHQFEPHSNLFPQACCKTSLPASHWHGALDRPGAIRV